MDIRKFKICANCDDVYTGFCCPMCASDEFLWLSQYVPPVNGLRDKILSRAFAVADAIEDKTDVAIPAVYQWLLRALAALFVFLVIAQGWRYFHG